MKKNIMLDTIAKVKEFSVLVSGHRFDIDLISGRHSVDAKSIMGIFSLDLSKKVTVEVHDATEAECEEFFASIKSFIVD